MTNLLLENTETMANRVIERCERLATISEFQTGIFRQYLTQQHAQANKLLADWMQQAGMTSWQDTVGNQWGRLSSSLDNAPHIVIGSHLDTVPNAGKYDGILGVLLAVEIANYFSQNNQPLPFHLDVVGFADEEGSRFDTTLIGSKALAGNFNAQWLDIKDRSGKRFAQAFEEFGLSVGDIAKSSQRSKPPLAYLEAHIEQGPVLESKGLALGIVSGIAGAKRAQLIFTGCAGHAGTTPMNLRQDALCAAAQTIIDVERLANNKTQGEVATVGQVTATPGATNVISGRSVLSLDVRALDDDKRDALIAEILTCAEHNAQQRHVTLTVEWQHEASAVKCDAQLQSVMKNCATLHGIETMTLPSGAGHDAMAIAELCPVAMLFLSSPNGLSHHPDEAVIPTDIEAAFKVLISTVKKLAQS